MKKQILLLWISIAFVVMAYPQSTNYDYVNVDEGTSYDRPKETNESITIPLHTIKLNGYTLPIYLSYNSKGVTVSDVPNSVGYGWNLVAGGSIEKSINHLIDESNNGWYFKDSRAFYQNINSGVLDANFSQYYDEMDAAPDVFRMSISNGDFLNFIYERVDLPQGSSTLKPYILNSSQMYASIGNSFSRYQIAGQEDPEYQDNDDSDIQIITNKGYQYSFRRGLKREMPWDIRRKFPNDSSYYHNYYLHTIKSGVNKDYLKFEYETTKLNKFLLHTKATRVQTNRDPRTPPSSSDPIITEGYYTDISVEDVSRKEISRITTNKEVIEFLYKLESYNQNLSQFAPSYREDVGNQQFRLLDKINIYDHKGNFIYGYQFNYTQQTQDQGDYEGSNRLKSVEKIGKNRIESSNYRTLAYYPKPYSTSVTSFARDVFDYPNGATRNNNYDNLILLPHEINRMPNYDFLLAGQLKSITNERKGKIEFTYKENRNGIMYFGGLLIEEIKAYDENALVRHTKYEYEDPEGYGLPVYDSTIYSGNPDQLYDKGFLELQEMNGEAWRTYFTKLDPYQIINPSLMVRYNVYNSPSGLKGLLSATNTAINSNNLQNYRQEEFGVFYKKVTTKRLNLSSGLAEKGYVIKYYSPSLEDMYLGRVSIKTEYFNSNDVIVKRISNSYNLANSGYIAAHKFDNVHMQTNQANPSLRRYVLEPFPIYKIKNVLRSTKSTEFDSSGNETMNNEVRYTYLNEDTPDLADDDYSRAVIKREYFNGKEYGKTEHKYFTNYNTEQLSQYLYYLNPILESSSWIKENTEWRLVEAAITEYNTNGTLKKAGIVKGNPANGSFYNDQNYVSSYYDSSLNFISLINTNIVEYQYDGDGYLSSKTTVDSCISLLYQRGEEYDGLYVDAMLTTEMPLSSNPTFLKKSFEDATIQNVVPFEKAFSGDYVYQGNTLSLGSFPSNYLVSYWYYRNNTWNYSSYIHSGGNVQITKPSGALYIDEVRVQPKDSKMISSTIIPMVGSSSILDDRGDGYRYEFDLFGRKRFTLDKDRNVLQEERKNYKQLND